MERSEANSATGAKRTERQRAGELDVEDQDHKRLYAWVKNSQGTWDRKRATPTDVIWAWDEQTQEWIKCRLVPADTEPADEMKLIEAAEQQQPGEQPPIVLAWDEYKALVQSRDYWKREAEGAREGGRRVLVEGAERSKELRDAAALLADIAEQPFVVGYLEGEYGTEWADRLRAYQRKE